jgi:hypothetical protein
MNLFNVNITNHNYTIVKQYHNAIDTTTFEVIKTYGYHYKRNIDNYKNGIIIDQYIIDIDSIIIKNNKQFNTFLNEINAYIIITNRDKYICDIIHEIEFQSNKLSGSNRNILLNDNNQKDVYIIDNNNITNVIKKEGYYCISFKEETLFIIDMDNVINTGRIEYSYILSHIRNNKLNELI